MPRKATRKSRRVNTYIKPKTIRQEVKFPYSRYRIDWIDIITEGGWGTEKEFQNMKLATPVSEGWLYNKDKYAVKLFASYDREEDGSLTFGDRTMIPLACVKKMTKLP